MITWLHVAGNSYRGFHAIVASVPALPTWRNGACAFSAISRFSPSRKGRHRPRHGGLDGGVSFPNRRSVQSLGKIFSVRLHSGCRPLRLALVDRAATSESKEILPWATPSFM